MFTIQIWPERGKNQDGRVLKLEQKLLNRIMEEVVKKRATLKCMIDGTEVLVLKKVYLTSTYLIIIRSVSSISTGNFADYRTYMSFERIGSLLGLRQSTGTDIPLEYLDMELRVWSTYILEITCL